MNACRDQRVGARSSAALMRMRFEIDVERAAAGSFTRGLEGLDFGVILASVAVGSSADDLAAAIGDDRADVGIGSGESVSGACEFEGAVEEMSSAFAGIERNISCFGKIALAADGRWALGARLPDSGLLSGRRKCCMGASRRIRVQDDGLVRTFLSSERGKLRLESSSMSATAAPLRPFGAAVHGRHRRRRRDRRVGRASATQ